MDGDETEVNDTKLIVNTCRIFELLAQALQHFHRIFKKRWSIYQKLINKKAIEWNDGDEECRQKLMELCSSAEKYSKESLKNDCVGLWDITASHFAIQAVTKKIQEYGGEIDCGEDKTINCIKQIRNVVSHSNYKLPDKDFEAYWKQISQLLAKLEEIDNLSNLSLNETHQAKVDSSQDVSSEDTEIQKSTMFTNKKKEADKLLKEQKYKEAIAVCCEALNVDGISPKNQASIFSIRSKAYLMLKDETSIELAHRDAELIIQLWPCWWKGYHQLAHAYMATSNWAEAEKFLNLALALNKSSTEARNDLYNVRTKLNSRQNSENKEVNFDDHVKKMSKELGRPEEEIMEYLKNNESQYHYVLTAFQHWNKKEYKKAFDCFLNAAKAGFPLAMINTALMYENGNGVIQSFEKSLEWYTKAAEASFSSEADRNDVIDAQFSLGCKYESGTGVVKDSQKAVYWFGKAASNGCPKSMNNLGGLYEKGIGVEKSSTTAFKYFKMAAQLGVTSSMYNLAQCYFHARGTDKVTATREDIEDGMKWLQLAADNGHLEASKALEERKEIEKLEGVISLPEDDTSSNNPLDYDRYGKLIAKAAKDGSVTAQRHMEIWKNLNIATDCLKNGDPDGVVRALAKAIRLNVRIVVIPRYFKSVITEKFKSSPEDLDTLVCYIQCNSISVAEELLFKTQQLNLKDVALIENTYRMLLLHANDPQKALQYIDTKLKDNPKCSRWLYCRAFALSKLEGVTAEELKAWDDFLAVAEKDDHSTPEAHYYKSLSFSLVDDSLNMIASFEAGCVAEEKQLPCFKPYKFSCKAALEKVCMHFKKEAENVKRLCPAQSAEKDYLAPTKISLTRDLKQLKSDLQRILMLKEHRMFLVNNSQYVCIKEKGGKVLAPLISYHSEKPKNSVPPTLKSLKKITLKDMDKTQDVAYNGFILNAEIIDFAIIRNEIVTVIEDENGDIERIVIYNWMKTEEGRLFNFSEKIREAMKTFQPNVLISIFNPCIRITTDQKPVVYVESSEYYELDNNSSNNKCSCCGQQAEVKACSKCLLSKYCSKACQRCDWHEFNHKDVCKNLLKFAF